ncbi:MAG: EAL domain-containing protein [Gammaproteobacteria bacterium]|nr:EAL domain-containing protein [Gammaproteobacteria bacterium]
MRSKLANMLPLSITAYGLLFILLGLLLFGGFSLLTVSELYTLHVETKQRNLHLAQEELQDTVLHVLAEGEKLAMQFAEWDESLQQFSNSNYYAYWRENRVPYASFAPHDLAGVELYNQAGVALARPQDNDMPAKLSLPITKTTLVRHRDSDNLYFTAPVAYDKQRNDIVGYVVVKIDLKKTLTEKQRFRFADKNTIATDLQDGQTIAAPGIVQHIHVADVPNAGFDQLQDLMLSTLQRFAVIGFSLAALLLYLLVHIFGLPSRRLSRHIDALRHGDRTLLQDTRMHKLSVAEFEKVRLSLNEYQTQLDHRDAEIRESEMRMRAVLDNVIEGIITLNEQGVIESCNPAAGRIFALPEHDIIGRSITSLIADAAQPAYRSYRNECFKIPLRQRHGNEACELTGKRGDQSEFPLEISLSRMQLAQRQLSIVVARDVTERKRSHDRLVYLANFDELTGLPNRTLFRDRLKQAIAHAKREERLVAVIYFDLDHFKKINDTLGHHAGDQLLLDASKRLRDTIREFDTVARLGGDEFVVVLGSVRHVEQVTEIATKLLQALEMPFALEGQEAFVAASAGIAIYPLDDTDIDNLVKNADTAMFRAKEQGGNSYQYFKAEMNAKAIHRLKMESALRYGLERNEFELLYQPRVNLHSGAILSMEALLRWNSQQFGNISPVQFIPLLEETGLIVPVGDWVLKTACEQTRRWHKAGYGLRVSVNLSVRQFRQKDLVKRFRSILHAADFDPQYLELEITEGLLVENMDAAVTILQNLHDVGVRISIDDFGIGYSSLSYLKRLPIDTIKIDRSFVADITDNPEDAVITAAIVALARSLRLDVTAEGIETKAQLDYLTLLGCDEAQGFYFSTPLPAQEFEHHIAQRHIVSKSAPA